MITPFYEIRKTDLTIKKNDYEVNFPEHIHRYIEIIYVYSGVQHIMIDQKEYTVNAGEAAVILPDTLHSYNGSKSKITNELLIMCSPKLLGALFPDYSNVTPEKPIISKKNIDKETLFALNNIKPESKFQIKFGFVCIIISNLIDVLNLTKRNKTPILDITYKISEYINHNFTEQITRDSLAKQFNLSRYYISRIFTDRFKMNLRKYLGLIRTEYAANLMRTTDLTFTAISREAGFESIRTFNRVFKEIYSITPKEYKSNIQKYKNAKK